jgi:hypothetical protein
LPEPKRHIPHLQILEVSAGELNVRDDLDLAAAGLRDLDVVAEVAGAALDLDAVVQELFERGQIKDLVVDGLRAVDGVLLDGLGALGKGLGGSGFL